MHKTTIYLEDPLYEKVQRLAEASRSTQASVIRQALVAFLGGKRKKPRSVGLGRSGRDDLSVRAEELLEGMGEDA